MEEHVVKEFEKRLEQMREIASDPEQIDRRKRQEIIDAEAEAAEREMRLYNMNIEPEFHDATLGNFQANTRELSAALERIRQLIAGDVMKLVMTGRNGTGKTHLACAAVKSISDGRQIPGKIMTMYEISATIRGTYSAQSRQTELSVVSELASIPILAIDEIGRTKGSETESNWLSYIIDKRSARKLPLILISNKHVKKHCTKGGCPDCLENYIGDDIMSRLLVGGVMLRFDGDDFRRKNGGNQ